MAAYEIALIVLAFALSIAGIIGGFLPVIPGPPLSWLGLLCMQFLEVPTFSTRFMWVWAIITVVVTVLDYVIPPYGTKRFGGTKYGVRGSTVGLILGLFFMPIGIIIGPLLGAFIGEIMGGRAAKDSIRPALGSFIGFLAGTALKLIVSMVMFGWIIASFF